MLPKYICAALSGHAHVCAYTRIALNLMRSLNEGSKSSAEKIDMRIALLKSSTCADRLLDNHVVISEHRILLLEKSAQSSQKMGFGKITPQSRSAETHFVNLVLND